MKNLLDGRFFPVTSTIGFLKCDHVTAAQAFVDWQGELQEKRGVSLTERKVTGELEFVLRQLLPLTSVERHRYLFIPTNSEWTAFVDNGYKGTDAFSTISYLAKKISCVGIKATDVPEGQHNRYFSVSLEMYGPDQTSFLNYIRSISLSYDGSKWTFSAAGNVQPFEDTQRYTSRSTKDRFSSDLLADYLKALGIDAYNQGFYLTPVSGAIHIEKHGPIATGARDFQLIEA